MGDCRKSHCAEVSGMKHVSTCAHSQVTNMSDVMYHVLLASLASCTAVLYVLDC